MTAQGGSEGAKEDPILLVSRTSHTTGRVAPSGTSYYKFQTEALSGSEPYLITLTGLPASVSLSWSVYSDANYSTPIASCYSSNWSKDVVCSTAETYGSSPLTPGTFYYLSVSNQYSTYATYTVGVSPLAASVGCSAGGTCYTFEGGTTSPLVGWSTDISSSGTGTYSARSNMANKNTQSTCLSLSNVTDVKLISFSLRTNLGGSMDALAVYLDSWLSGTQLGSEWTGINQWQRVVVRPPSGGLHSFLLCHEKGLFDNVTDNNAWVDDVELNY